MGAGRNMASARKNDGVKKIVNVVLRSRPFQVIQLARKIGPAEFVRWTRLSGKKKYAMMQKQFYEASAKRSEYGEKKVDYVVGSFDLHNAWKDYDTYLMRYVDKTYRNKLALDFGCGPGRSIIKYSRLFKRLDGIDISRNNILNARRGLKKNRITNSKLYVNNGTDLRPLRDDTYDFVMSTICLQHICVYDTRFSLLKDMYRVLKPGGRISLQMGFGTGSPATVPYYTNEYDAPTTNRGLDTAVESPDQIGGDLKKIGFTSYEYWIRPTGPGDVHKKWIFFTAVKPK